MYASPNATTLVTAALEFEEPTLTLTYDNWPGGRSRDKLCHYQARLPTSQGVSTAERTSTILSANPDTARLAAAATSGGSFSAPPRRHLPLRLWQPRSLSDRRIPHNPRHLGSSAAKYAAAGYSRTEPDTMTTLRCSQISAFFPSDDVDFLEYLRNFQDSGSQVLAASKTGQARRGSWSMSQEMAAALVLAGYELFAQVRT